MVIGMSFITCSLIYMILLCIVYFTKKRIKTTETEIYAQLLILNAIGLILELACCFTVQNMDRIPTLNLICNRAYLIYFATFVTLFTVYIYVACSKTDLIEKQGVIKFNKYEKFCIFFVYFLLMISVMFLPLKYNNTPEAVYSYGLATDVLSFACCIFMIFDFVCMFTNLRKLNMKKIIPMIALLICFVLAFIVRNINPGIILITCSFAFVTAIMYFTIENPDFKMLKDMEIARNQAEKANNAKSDFLSSMSHEIRTPLNAIVGLSEDIDSFRGQVPLQVVEDTEDIRAASQTLLEIVGNILDINKIESQKMEITNEVYNPREEIEKLAKIDATRIGEKPVDFKVNIAEDLPYELIGDRLHIKQVLNNLLSNAFKYTEKGEVNLTVKCVNQNHVCNLMISVQDTGRGIKAENINKLFTKFERLDVEMNSTTEGTGLGLAITKSLVEMMGGKINVQSQFGQGSLFVVTLPQKIKTMNNPITDTQVIRLTEIRKAELNNAYFGAKKILIVDDNKLNIKVARRALQDFNFEIDECYDGQECLDKVKAGNEYDLILMDIMMANMSGESAIAHLKENPNFTIPTIALTADAVAGAKEKYISEGFVDYIAKPFSKDQIKEKLDSIFNNGGTTNNSEVATSVETTTQNVAQPQMPSDLDDVEKQLLDMSKPLNEIELPNNSNN